MQLDLTSFLIGAFFGLLAGFGAAGIGFFLATRRQTFTTVASPHQSQSQEVPQDMLQQLRFHEQHYNTTTIQTQPPTQEITVNGEVLRPASFEDL